MAMEFERPKFLPAFLGLLRQEAEQSSWNALIPYGLIMCATVGLAAAWLIPEAFWKPGQLPISTVIITGIMTLDGLMLALGWNAFGRVYDKIFGGSFGEYLAEKKLLNNYLVHITIMHWSQAGAVIASGAALILLLINQIPLSVQRVIFAVVIMASAYSIKQAVAAIEMMNDLVWQSNAFEGWTRRTSGNGQQPLKPLQGGRNAP